MQELVAIGDHLVGRSGLCSIRDLRTAIRPGARGAQRLREAVGLVRVGAESPMETLLRLMIIDAGFPEPQLNRDVHDAAGRFIGRPDLSYPELRIAVEYDGDHHRTDRTAFAHDQRRANAFTVEGWLVLHVVVGDIRAPAVFFDRLRTALRHRRRG